MASFIHLCGCKESAHFEKNESRLESAALKAPNHKEFSSYTSWSRESGSAWSKIVGLRSPERPDDEVVSAGRYNGDKISSMTAAESVVTVSHTATPWD